MPFSNENNSLNDVLATKMQLILDQPMADLSGYLVNNDFEGDFFKVGATVNITKPDPSSVKVEVGEAKDDARLRGGDLEFKKSTLTIDKRAVYSFIVSDITNAEGKWNYESGGLDLAAQELRKAHNLEIANLIANDANIKRIGFPTDPIVVADGDDLYKKVIVKMYTALYNSGAITASGQVTFGSNPQEKKATRAGIIMPQEGYSELLTSKYFTDRSTVAADNKVETADIQRILGMDVAIEPSLSQTAKRKIEVESLTTDTFVIIAGTRNCVTKAGKVLRPEQMRNKDRFATNYEGLEIYGMKVFSPQSAVVAFVKIGTGA